MIVEFLNQYSHLAQYNEVFVYYASLFEFWCYEPFWAWLDGKMKLL